MAPFEVSIIPLRVLPGDLDVNLHMNNGRYLTMMDLGRTDWLVRIGLVRPMVKRRWLPMVASQFIRYRTGLSPFQKFELHTRMLGWDDHWFFFEQKFMAGERLAAFGVIKGVLKGPKGSVPPGEILKASGHDVGSPVLPAYIGKWLETEEVVRGTK